MKQVEVWRGRHGDPVPLLGPLPGVRSDDTVAYEFRLPGRFEPWPGRTLLERVFVLLDLDEFADAIEAGQLDIGTAADGLRRWQRFLDRHLHAARDPRTASGPTSRRGGCGGLRRFPPR